MTQAARDMDVRPRRLAVIDVGTNSIRLIVAEARFDGSYRVIDDEKVMTRLGAGMTESGDLAAEAMDRSAEAIARMKAIAEGYVVEQLRAVATCAVREAVNREAFVDLVKAMAGLDLEVISAEEEARYAYLSVANVFDLRSGQAAIADIGGGSTEIVQTAGGVVEQVHSLPLGAVRLTERFEINNDPSGERFREMRKHITKLLRSEVAKPETPAPVLYGSGGTFTALARISMFRNKPSEAGNELLSFAVRGYELQRDEVKHLALWLRDMPPKVRESVPGLSPDRADIIVAGLAIVDCVMKRLGVNRL
ncbi:MAG: Ppx/GppA phosphatase family protein, partial [Planctomycetota bacterium]|nr:Ppx/GppA phosphatase family protein [Planctomycetota bacterium]